MPVGTSAVDVVENIDVDVVGVEVVIVIVFVGEDMSVVLVLEIGQGSWSLVIESDLKST